MFNFSTITISKETSKKLSIFCAHTGRKKGVVTEEAIKKYIALNSHLIKTKKNK